jgi:hypothetical protein
MAKNEVFRDADRLQIAATDPATPVSGDPLVYGQRPGVCEVSEGTDGLCTAKFSGEFTFSVKGVTTAAANSAVAEGDIIYYVPGNTPKLSKAVGDAGAVRFGYAAGAVTSGSTTTIPVILGY